VGPFLHARFKLMTTPEISFRIGRSRRSVKIRSEVGEDKSAFLYSLNILFGWRDACSNDLTLLLRIFLLPNLFSLPLSIPLESPDSGGNLAYCTL